MVTTTTCVHPLQILTLRDRFEVQRIDATFHGAEMIDLFPFGNRTASVFVRDAMRGMQRSAAADVAVAALLRPKPQPALVHASGVRNVSSEAQRDPLRRVYEGRDRKSGRQRVWLFVKVAVVRIARNFGSMSRRERSNMLTVARALTQKEVPIAAGGDSVSEY
jgi:hypothetical protein